MTWNQSFYGSETPTPSKRIFYNILGAALFICWYGLKTEFVVSVWWLTWGSVSALMFCRLCQRAHGSARDSRLERGILHVAGFAMLLFIIWTTLVRVMPDLSTRWTQPEVIVEAELHKKREFGRGICDYQPRGQFLRFHPLGYACISGAEFERLPVSGLMRITGRQSAFGIHVERVEPMSADKLLE